MKVAYLGGTRGYQSAIYRPGVGWKGTGRRWRIGREPLVFKKERRVRVCPLTVASRNRPGPLTKTFIISSVVVVTAVLTVLLSGGPRY